MGKSRFIELMAKSLDGSASEAELKELDIFLEQYPHYKKVQHITHALESGMREPAANVSDADINSRLDALWVNIKKSEDVAVAEIPEKKVVSINKFRQWAAGAAAIAVLCTGGYLYYKGNKTFKQLPDKATQHVVNVPYGKMIKLNLADGTMVKLNAGSHFSYPDTFTGNERNVTLDGEGFFEVAKNAKKPFLVHTASLTVRVLGTVFNVRAYKEDKKIETTLFNGKIQVELKDAPEQKITLSPLDKLTVLNSAVTAKQPVNTPRDAAKLKYELSVLPAIDNAEYQENAWLDNKLIFTNTDFEEVAVSMERKYKVHIFFQNQALKKEQLSGVFKDESLDTALQFLKQVTPFQSKISGDTVYLNR